MTKGAQAEYRCSFCDKSGEQVARLIAGPGGVYICDECVGLCEEIISEEPGVVLVVTYMAKAGESEAIEAALAEMIRLTRQEPGNLRYTVQRSKEEPRKYLLYETYRDQAALEAHSNADYFKRYVVGEIAPRLESRVREFYEPLEPPIRRSSWVPSSPQSDQGSS